MKKLIIPKLNLDANSALGAIIADTATVEGLVNSVEYQAFNIDQGSELFTPFSQYTNEYARAWGRRLPTPLSNERALLFDNLFTEINDIIPKLDALYVFHGAETRSGARLNLVQDRFNVVEVLPENIEFNQNSGFNIKAGSTGGASQYLDTGINFVTSENLKSSFNNKSLGIGAFSVFDNSPAFVGNFNSANTNNTLGRTFLSLFQGSRLDTTATRQSTGFITTGHAAIVRNNGSSYVRYVNSTLLETIPVISATPINQSIVLLSRLIATDVPSPSPLAYFFTGAALTEVEYQTMYYALNRFYNALGAEPLAARTVQGSLTSA